MNYPKWVWVQNKLVASRAPALSVFDHGFLYGDGAYETVRVYNGHLFHWPEHARRFVQSAKGLGLKFPWSASELARRIRRTLTANHLSDAVVRLTLSRGVGPLGFDTRLCPVPTLVIIALAHPGHPTEIYEQGVGILLPQIRRNPPQSLNPAFKSTNNLNNILAKQEAVQAKVFESVFLNIEGYLAEGTISNLFFVRGKKLFTPSLTCGILPGVTRDLTVRLARRRGWPVHEGRYRPVDLWTATEAFLTSTTLEIVPIRRVLSQGQSHFLPSPVPGPITQTLLSDYRKHISTLTRRSH